MAATKSTATVTKATRATSNGNTATSFVDSLAFEPTEAPVAKGGPGRKANPEMVALMERLAKLPLIEKHTESADGWVAVNVPDVSTFVDLVRQAGNKLGCSFQIRHDVKITDDDKLNPGLVKLRRIARRVRGPRKSSKSKES